MKQQVLQQFPTATHSKAAHNLHYIRVGKTIIGMGKTQTDAWENAWLTVRQGVKL